MGKETVGVTAKDNRLFVEAVLYRYRLGNPWRDLLEGFGNFKGTEIIEDVFNQKVSCYLEPQ